MKTEKREQKQIGEIQISDTDKLIATLVNKEKLDLRVWVETEKYQGPTKRGVRFYLFDSNWCNFKRLIEKIDKLYENL